jgi:polysaccharide biosynthesis protein PelB
MPPAVALGLGLLVAGALAFVFPYRSLEEEISRAGRTNALADPLQIAYLRAWLRVRPELASLRLTLATQLANANELAAARAELAALNALDEARRDPRQMQRALLLELDIGGIELSQLPAGDPQALALRSQLHARLAEVARSRITIAQVDPFDVELARRATGLQARDAARLLWQRVLASSLRLPPRQWEDAGRAMLGLGEADVAAELLFAARRATSEAMADTAASRGEERRLFRAALAALQSEGNAALALSAAERELGTLAADTETLEFLTRLALAANRPEIAQRYARMLLKLALLPAAVQALQARGAPVPPGWLALLQAMTQRVQEVQYMRSAPPVQQAQEAAPARDAELQRTPRLPYDERLYTLAFEVFVANGNLRDAIAVAQAAVRQVPGNPSWRLRLAQVADWSGDAPLALEQWHAMALASNDPAAWAEVQRRAPQVFDTARWLQALEFALQRRPGDFALTRQLVAAYEQQGVPERAIALLQRLPASADAIERRQRLELLAELAQRSGRDDVRTDTLQRLVREFGARTAYALGLAELAYARGDIEGAFGALAAAAPNTGAPVAAEDLQREFWLAYADMALATGRPNEAEAALRLLVASPNAGESDFTSLIALTEPLQPLEAAALAETAFTRFGTSYLALQSLRLWIAHGRAQDVRAFLARRTVAERKTLAREPAFALQLAAFHLREGDTGAAIAAARQALALDAQLAEARALLIWALLAQRDGGVLRAELLAQAQAPAKAPELDAPFAAAWLALHEPRRALIYLRPTAAARQDPLWLTASADAYEQLGHVELAWQLRRLAWLATPGTASAAGSAAYGSPASPADRAARELALQAERRQLSLAPTFSTSDAARERLQRLLRADPTVKTGEGRDAVLGYAISRGLYELADAWLQQQYRNSRERPGWGALSVALANDDRAQIAVLLDSAPEWLPLADRVDAAARVRRRGQAQSLAFDALEGRPENDLLQERLVNNTLAPLAAAQGLDGTLRGFRQRPLEERAAALAGTLALGQRYWLHAVLGRVERSSTDTAQLLDPPDERNASLTLGGGALAEGARLRWSVGLQQRTVFATTTGALAQAQWRATPRLDLSAALGLAQPTTDNALLRAGGQRDFAEAAAELRPSLREFIVLGASSSRLQAQGGGAVGDTQTLRAELGHRVRLEYPDLTVRLTYANLRYRARDGVAAPLLALVPEEQRPFASNATLLPQSTEQWALRASCGDSVVATYTRGWRLFCGAALTHDAQGGAGSEWLLGARGAVFGTDQLELSVGGGTRLGATRIPYTEIIINYRSFF